MHHRDMGKSRLHVMFLGLRGIPSIQGGIETHVENIARRLISLDCSVTVINRKPYIVNADDSWMGVQLVELWSPSSRRLEAILHTFIGVIYAAVHRPDILHIHGIGPSILTPFARVLGLKVIVTHHGPDYERQKWGGFAKYILKTGEKFAAKFANQVISISSVITDLMEKKYNCVCIQIPNGVNIPEVTDNHKIMDQFAIKKGQYVLQVSRIVPEKRQSDLIKAFSALNTDWKLVIVGSSDHPDVYTRDIEKYADTHENIVLTGFRSGQELQNIFINAGIFVLPSSHEGLPIALLEALSFGLPSIASDIPANLEVQLEKKHYFKLGDISALSAKLSEFMDMRFTDEMKNEIQQSTFDKYNWDEIARKTKRVYLDELEDSTLHKRSF